MPDAEKKEEFKKKVLEMAKSRGLDAAEDAAGDLAELALDVVGLVVEQTSNKYDDMVWAAVEGKAREGLASLVDKIDGQEG